MAGCCKLAALNPAVDKTPQLIGCRGPVKSFCCQRFRNHLLGSSLVALTFPFPFRFSGSSPLLLTPAGKEAGLASEEGVGAPTATNGGGTETDAAALVPDVAGGTTREGLGGVGPAHKLASGKPCGGKE